MDELHAAAASRSPAGDSPLVHLQGLRRRYGDRWVLDGVDLELMGGSVLGLLGRNGAGKSTLLRCLLGLSPLDGGSARAFGVEGMRLGADEKSRIGYVAQQANLQPWMTAERIVEYVSAYYEGWDADLVDRLMRAWDIPRTQRLVSLSPGEAQRLSIILALGHHPKLLILDEPAASLDPTARRAVISAVLEAVASDGAGVILSSHLTGDLERVADRVAFLANGRITIDCDLGTLKDTVKRLRISGAVQPRPHPIPGSVACDQREDGAVVTVRLASPEAFPELARALSERHRASVVVEDLSLEDIFVAVSA